MRNIRKIPVILAAMMIITSCGGNDTSEPQGPDLTGVAERDLNYFNEIYNRCSINNSVMDCNCVARVNVEHRDAAYDIYAAEYETIHKPALEEEIKTKTATLVEKTKNLSDERVLEALELELHDLEAKLKAGVDNIDNFELPFLPAGATDSCRITE